MKSLKFMPLCLLSAALIAGCGGKSSSNPSSSNLDQPQVADGTVVAVGWRNPTEGKFKKLADETLSKLKASEDPQALEILKFLDSAGLDTTKIKWGLLTSSKPEVEGDDLKRCPDVALVLSIPHDMKKLTDAIAAIAEGAEVKLEEVTLANQKATRFLVDEPEMDKLGVTPHLASLEGKLLIAASNEKCMEREIALYLEGKGASPDFKDFTFGADEVFRLTVPQVGRLVSEVAGDKLGEICELYANLLPDGDKIVTSLGAVQLLMRAPGGNSLDVSLIVETGTAEHAESLVALINGGLMPVRAQLKKSAADDEDAKVASELLEKFSAKAAGNRITLTLPIPPAFVDKAIDTMEKELLNNL